MHIVRRIPWLFIALIAYYLPWVFHKTAALTAQAYDLAELVSLAPEVRNGNPPLLAPFLLRFVLVGLAVLFALQAAKISGWVHWLYVAMAWMLVITLLPPLEFFRGSFDDPNYRQQFALSVGALIGVVGTAVLFHRKVRWLQKLTVPIVLSIVIAAVVGEVLAWNVIASLGIHEVLGGGVVILIASLVMLLIGCIGDNQTVVSV
jgi:hypothetical protein